MSSFIAAVFLCGVLCLYTATAERIKYYPCDGQSQSGKITEIDITPCPDVNICQFKQGSNVTVKIMFSMGTVPAKLVTTVIHGIIGPLSLPFSTPYKDACSTTGIHCPLAAGSPVVYEAKLAILKEYPEVNVMVKWELKDESLNEIICFEAAAQIVS